MPPRSSLGRKVGLGFAVQVVILTIAAAVGYRQFGRVVALEDRVDDEQAEAEAALLARAEFRQAATRTLDFLVSGDRGFLRARDSLLGSGAARLRRLQAAGDTVGEAAGWAAAREALARWEVALRATDSLRAPRLRPGGVAALRTAIAARERLEQALGAARSIVDAQRGEAIIALRSASHETRRVLLGGTLFALLIAILSGALLTRRTRDDLVWRERAADELKDRDAQLRHFFDEAPLGKSLTAPDGRLLRVNASFGAMLGYTAEELQAGTFSRITHPDDVAASEEVARSLIAGRQDVAVHEKRYIAKDGHVVWAREITRLHRDKAGAPEYFITHVDDVTERRHMREAVRDADARFLRLADNAPDVIYRYRLAPPSFEFVSAAITPITGYRPDEFYRDVAVVWQLVHPEDRRLLQAALAGTLTEREPFLCRWISRDGRVVWTEHRINVVRGDSGSPDAIEGNARDISDRVAADAVIGLRTRALEAAANTVLITDTRGIIQWANPAFTTLTGYDVAEAMGRRTSMLKSGRQPDALYRELWQTVLSGRPWSGELVNRRKDGSLYTEEMTITPVRDGSGAIAHFIAIKQDVSERRAAEAALRQAHERLTKVLDVSTVGVMFWDLTTGCMTDANDAFLRMMGYSRADVDAHTLTWQKLTPPEYYDLSRAELEQVATTGRIGPYEKECIRKDGTRQWFVFAGSSLGGDTCVEFCVDISARKRAEAAVEAGEARFREIAEHITQVFFVADRERRCLYLSPAFEQVWGRPVATALGDGRGWEDGVHPDDRVGLQQVSQTRFGGQNEMATFRVVRPDGAVRWVRSRAFPVPDADGEVRRVVGIAEDITELRTKEQQLAQSQRMEAIGQLAGGVAHDFNNVLTVILGFAEMLKLDINPDDPRSQDVAQIVGAVRRAQGLTRQLLAFSRQQNLQPVVLDPEEALTGIEKMLRRLIGEHIDLTLQLGSGSACIRVDPGQLEQVLMNLAVNARDAMHEGGRLTIATSCLEIDADGAGLHGLAHAGRYLVITVTDTGTGMTPDVRARIFEPFFTTKEHGGGTGLGLATVYGIVKQSGGAISAYSEPGSGSVFRVYFPVTEEPRTPRVEHAPVRDAEGHGETILVVEDDPSLRGAVTQMLQRHGYVVETARNGEEALTRMAAEAPPVRLVLSDVIMPGMNGGELARRLLSQHPGLRIILASGYTGDPVLRQDVFASGLPLIEKPFTTAGLLERVREVLDA